jgi:hypothetical protein
MKKPVYQSILEFLMFFVPALVLVVGVIDGFINTISFISYRLAGLATLAVVTIYISLLLLFRYRRFRWVSKSGQPLRMVRFSDTVNWALSAMLCILWLGALYNAHVTERLSSAADASGQQPVFNAKDNRFKVLIVRFNQECDYQGLRYDIGQVVQHGLENKKITDTINLATYYLDDSSFSMGLQQDAKNPQRHIPYAFAGLHNYYLQFMPAFFSFFLKARQRALLWPQRLPPL